MKGRVKFWNVRKGWGFIIAGDIKYFAHHSDIKSDNAYKLLIDNQAVEFDPVDTDKGPKAKNIRPTDFVSKEVVYGTNDR